MLARRRRPPIWASRDRHADSDATAHAVSNPNAGADQHPDPDACAQRDTQADANTDAYSDLDPYTDAH
jgi:hypothetical protein